VATITYLEAISQGLAEEMRRDASVFLLGEDIGVYGGAFKVTKGFIEEFGKDRVLDTPLSEIAIVGVSVGAALIGMRPVAEMQFADFVSNGFNQIVNNAAKLHYRLGAAVPMVIRCPSGGGVSGGPFHSQNPEGWFAHTPGLKIVCPATPEDAKGLIKASIRDDNPVLYFEHKKLYRHIKGEVPDGDYVTPLGKGRVHRPGRDLTIITYAAMVYEAEKAASELAREGIETEIIDLRTVLPYDKELVLDSVRRCNRVIVLHEDTLTSGIGGDIAAFISQEAFESLDAPVTRIAALDTPVPFSPPLEKAFLPNAEKILTVARKLLTF